MRKVLLVFASILAWASASGQDVMHRTFVRLDRFNAMGNEEANEHSVASWVLSPYLDISTAGLEMTLRDETDARKPQLGDGLTQGAFNADSFKRLKDGAAVTGGVSYKRGVKRNVIWNETSDYDFLQPYVMADSVGGNLQTEQYSFHGGWAKKLGDRMVVGIEGDYRALHEYRNFDPRPRNITSDFHAKGSVGYLVGDTYLIGVLGYRKYHQSQGISFLNSAGANTTLFHLTGLGTHFQRFEGTSTYSSTRYRGKAFDMALLARPKDSDRFMGGVSFTVTDVVTHLINQNEAPITELLNQELSVFGSYKYRKDSFDAGVMLKASYELRQGDENVIDNTTSGTFRNLLQLTMFRSRTFDIDLNGLLQFRRDADTWRISPTAGFDAVSSSIVYPYRQMGYSFINAGLEGGILHKGEKAIADLSLGIKYNSSLGNTFNLPLEYTSQAFYDAWSHMCDRLSDGWLQLDAMAGLNIMISKGMALSGKLGAELLFFASGEKETLLKASLGITF